MATNLQHSMDLVQGVWRKCLHKADAALANYDFPVVFSSLADVLYLSVVWFDTRSATLTKLEFLRATQQASQSAATLISSDTEMMAVLCGLLDRQDRSPPEYPFSVYRPFAFWKPADLEMLRIRKIMP